MTFGVGVALLLGGLALNFLARERADGTSILRLGDGMMMVYPVMCLTLIAFGLALMIGS
jgi:hypothetical protein